MRYKSINEWPDRYRFALISILFAAIFLLDTRTPSGYVDYALYIIALIYVPLFKMSQLILFCSIASLLIISGFFFQPQNIPLDYAIINRFIIAATLWGGPPLLQRRLRVRAKLIETRNRLRIILDTIPIGVYIIEEAGEKVSFANRRAKQLWGTEEVGRTFAEYLVNVKLTQTDGSPYPVYELPMYKALRGEKGFGAAQLKVQRAGGVAFYVEGNAAPIHDARGRIVAAAVIFDDISERKKAEEILKRDKETLDRLVSERSRKLVEAQLALQRSQRLSDIGQLAATVAHELRNPLAAIDLARNNIRRRAEHPERLTNSLGTISKKVVESDQIINNLLFYSRIRVPHFQNVDIRELLAESIRVSKARFTGRDGEVIADTEALRDLKIQADPVQIKELFINIINNAFDAIPKDKKGKIEVDARADDDVKVSIRDNGSGIGKENLERIFEPFYSTKSRGTGLGLAVCRQIAQAHHGKITVDSEVGKGTTFTVILPKTQKQHPAPGF